MTRLLGYSLLLAAINLLCQAGLMFFTGEIDLRFGAFAGLLVIPLFQGAVVVIASPAPDRVTLSSSLRTVFADRIALTIAAVLVLVVLAGATTGQREIWRAALVGELIALIGTSIASFIASRTARPVILPAVALASVLIVAETATGFLRTLPARFDSTPTVLVLLATYVPLFAIAILLMIFLERSLSRQCGSSARLVDVAMAFAVPGALVVAGNYFNHPWVGPEWVPVVRGSTLTVVAALIFGQILFLRHDRGGHVDHG